MNRPAISPTGFLVSQIGYDLGHPMRAIVRGPIATLSCDAHFEISRAAENGAILRGSVNWWGEIWGSHWWIADFSELDQAGEFQITIWDGANVRFEAKIESGAELLWEKTWWPVSVDQAERRARLAKNRVGWQDCGSHWQEANSHSAFLVGLLDILERAPARLNEDEHHRLEAQIVNGCAYLARLQDLAQTNGHGEGALVHEIPTFENEVLPGDVIQAALVWARAARLLGPLWDAEKRDFTGRSRRAFDWFQSAAPCGARGFNPTAHGVEADWNVPDEHLTCDLMLALSAAWELSRVVAAPEEVARLEATAFALARRIGARQVEREAGQNGLWGYFRTFDSDDLPEKAWLHSLGKSGLGSDVTATFPHWVMPLLEMARHRPDHPEALFWRQLLHDFAYGYFLPACRANPFFLLPLGLFPGQGLLWFAGLWHGMSGVYGFAAALAREFEAFFEDAAFDAIATGNLQWIAGLNAGLTADSLFASHMWSAFVPEGEALPVSFICGIGRRCAGNWLNVRGSICNGFSTGDQFVFDVEPTRQNDGPFAFTDEDWIPHAGGWLCALTRSL